MLLDRADEVVNVAALVGIGLDWMLVPVEIGAVCRSCATFRPIESEMRRIQTVTWGFDTGTRHRVMLDQCPMATASGAGLLKLCSSSRKDIKLFLFKTPFEHPPGQGEQSGVVCKCQPYFHEGSACYVAGTS